MAGQLTIAQAQAILKVKYPDVKVAEMAYKGRPLLALMPKDTNFVGELYDLPLHFGGNTGGAATMADAVASKAGGKYGRFLLTRARDYAVGSIENEAVKASASDVGAFVKVVSSEVDRTMNNASNNLNRMLYGNGGSARGRIASGSGTDTLQLATPSDIVNFEVGMYICSDDTDGTAGGADDGEYIQITHINRKAGTIKASGVTWNSNSNFAANDYLFRKGDFGLALSGLQAWIPTTAPGATTFFGQDRSLDVTRLGGMRYDGSSQSIEEALIDANSELVQEGGDPSHIFMHPKYRAALVKEMGSRVIWDKVSSPDRVNIGFRTVSLTGENGNVQIVSDRNCPYGYAYQLTMKDFVFASLGVFPGFIEGAFGTGHALLEATNDAVEFRMGGYGQVGCKNPGASQVITLPSLS
jgi:hypothetical protein